MTRIVSGAVLVAFALVAVWWSPHWLFLLLACGVVWLAVWELGAMSSTRGQQLPLPFVALLACAVVTTFAPVAVGVVVPLEVVLLAGLVGLGALSLPVWKDGRDAVAMFSESLLPALYLGLPVGALVAIREREGAGALFLLMLTVMVSDSAQYFTGRALGRRPLAPRISPKKTIEGAAGGVVCGAATLAIAGHWWLPSMPLPWRLGLGVAIVALGIVGDLFESMLKRGVGLKDSGTIIPGHGGILDRFDALLFTAPAYYLLLRYV